MYKNFTFNNVKKDWVRILSDIERPPFSPIMRNTANIVGGSGSFLTGTGVEPLIMNVPIGIKRNKEQTNADLREELSEWLYTKEPAPLVFDDSPDRTYYAVVENTMEDFMEFANYMRGTITFLCVDPFKYGPEKQITSTEDAFIVESNGTADSDPIFELTAKKRTTFAMVTNGTQYNLVGKPLADVEQPYERYERILTANGTNMTGWIKEGNVVDGGIVSGNMESNGSRFQAESFGSGSNWHGPAIKRSLPETLTDFRIKTRIAFGNTRNNYIGRIEMYLLDVNGETVAKIALKDNQGARQLAIGEGRAGNLDNGKYVISNDSGDRPGVWNNFSGILEIERINNQWRFYIAKIDSETGTHHSRRNNKWTDNEGLYTGNVASIMLHVATVGTNTAPAMGFYGVMVDKVNQEPEKVPYIVEPGEKIIFDHKNDDIFVDGVHAGRGVLGATSFKLHKGYNTVFVEPEGAFETKVTFGERYR